MDTAKLSRPRAGFDPSRVRSGEWIAAGSAVLLLAFMLLAPWYGVSGVFSPTARLLGIPSLDGWDALSHLRWLILLTVIAALLLLYLQGTRPAPALPVSFSVIVTVLGTLTLLALVYRVLIDVPGPDGLLGARAGAYLGLVSAAAIVYGGFRSIREEGIAEADAPAEIETVRRGLPADS